MSQSLFVGSLGEFSREMFREMLGWISESPRKFPQTIYLQAFPLDSFLGCQLSITTDGLLVNSSFDLAMYSKGAAVTYCV